MTRGFKKVFLTSQSSLFCFCTVPKTTVPRFLGFAASVPLPCFDLDLFFHLSLVPILLNFYIPSIFSLMRDPFSSSYHRLLTLTSLERAKPLLVPAVAPQFSHLLSSRYFLVFGVLLYLDSLNPPLSFLPSSSCRTDDMQVL